MNGLANTNYYNLKKSAPTDNIIDTIGIDLPNNFDVIDSVVANRLNYEPTTVVGRQIRFTGNSGIATQRFKLDADIVAGTVISISLDGGATSKNLKDIEGADILELEKGFYEVIADATFFTLRPSGGGLKSFFGDGSDGVLSTTAHLTLSSVFNGPAVVKQYESITVNTNHTLGIDMPCQGLVLYSKGDVVINGGISVTQKGAISRDRNPIPMVLLDTFIDSNKKASLLNFDGANNSTVIVDDAGITWSALGSAVISTEFSKFGGSSLKLGTDGLIYTNVPPNLGSRDFTIEFQLKMTNAVGSTDQNILLLGYTAPGSSGGNLATYGLSIRRIGTTGYLRVELSSGSGSANAFNSTNPYTTTEFSHIRLLRSKNFVYLYINGVLSGSKSYSGVIYNPPFAPGDVAGNTFMVLGSGYTVLGGYRMTGYIDAFSIVFKAETVGNFTPPTVAPVLLDPTEFDKVLKLYTLASTTKQLFGGDGGDGGRGGSTAANVCARGGAGGGGRLLLGGLGGGGGGGMSDSGTSPYGLGGIGGDITDNESAGNLIPTIYDNFRQYLSRNTTTGFIACYGTPGYNGSGGGGGSSAEGSLSAQIGVARLGGNCGGGGGGGASGTKRVDSNYYGNAAGNHGNYPGGYLLIIAGGNVIVNGVIQADGGSGGAGGAGLQTPATVFPGGGGGGAGGGVIQILHKGTFTNNGTIRANGGTGGVAGFNPTGYSTGLAYSGASGTVGTIDIQQI